VDERAIRQLLDDVRTGRCTADDAVAELRRLPFADLGFARVDHHRTLRHGTAETVYGPGKTPAQCVAIVDELLRGGTGPVVVSRADATQAAALAAAHPGAAATAGPSGTATLVWRARETWTARTGSDAARGDHGGEAAPVEIAGSPGAKHTHGDSPGPAVDASPIDAHAGPQVVIVAAGTADLPVADECAAVLSAHGVAPRRLTDVGVAGLHRLIDSVEALQSADIVIVVAGMEGALASVVGGLTGAPVVAVPTSVGYGAGLEGVTALLAMLSSCAAGITVVGIDNGYGAASATLRLLHTAGATTPLPELGGETVDPTTTSPPTTECAPGLGGEPIDPATASPPTSVAGPAAGAGKRAAS
jgi:NCAIR mutase (PurE)-related protein